MPTVPLFRLLCCFTGNSDDSDDFFVERPTVLRLTSIQSMVSSGAGSHLSSPHSIESLSGQAEGSFGFSAAEQAFISQAKAYAPGNYGRFFSDRDGEEALHRELLMYQQLGTVTRIVFPNTPASSAASTLQRWLYNGLKMKYVITEDGFLSLIPAYSNELYDAPVISRLTAASLVFRSKLPPEKQKITTHTFAAAGARVIAAGTAQQIAGDLIITNSTGHYQCESNCLPVARIFWQKALNKTGIEGIQKYPIRLFDYLNPEHEIYSDGKLYLETSV